MAGFRKSVYNNHNSGETNRRRDIRDEIYGQIGPRPLDHGKGVEFPYWIVQGRFCLDCGKGYVRPGQQPIPHLHGDVDAFRREGSRRGFSLQSLEDVNIYVPKHRPTICGDGLMGWRTLIGLSTDMKPQVIRESRSPDIRVPRGDFHPQPGDCGVMMLEPREADDDCVRGSDDDEGKAFLVIGSHGEGEWFCDVRDGARSQWLFI
jgi:hypothetical protein